MLVLFDKQDNGLMLGQVVGTTQLSWYIRTVGETECNGYTFKPGELRRADLAHFDMGRLPRRLLGWYDKNPNTPTCLYEFRHWAGPKDSRRKVVHGYIITTQDSRTVLDQFVVGPTYKSGQLIELLAHQIEQKARNS